MDDRERLNDYIAGAYDSWVSYAARYIGRSKLPLDPREVVNDILCSLIDRDADRLICAMNTTPKGSDLDFLMMRTIKMAIYSPRSPFRYQRGQHCTQRMVSEQQGVVAGDEENNFQADVLDMLERVALPDLSKRVFVWRIYGNPIAKWPGPEPHRTLYRAYNKAVKKIIEQFGKK